MLPDRLQSVLVEFAVLVRRVVLRIGRAVRQRVILVGFLRIGVGTDLLQLKIIRNNKNRSTTNIKWWENEKDRYFNNKKAS